MRAVFEIYILCQPNLNLDVIHGVPLVQVESD
jgi:hypothetical protein